jgi:putative heme transporter
VHRPRADRIGSTLYLTVGRYFAGSLLVATLAGLAALVAGLAIGIPIIPLAALWIAVTNLIPQIGGFLGGSVFVALGFTAGPGTGLAALAYFLVWQQLENHVIQPAVIGQAVNLSPPTTMMAALIGASTAGVPGAMVAVPLIGAAKVLSRELIVDRRADRSDEGDSGGWDGIERRGVRPQRSRWRFIERWKVR